MSSSLGTMITGICICICIDIDDCVIVLIVSCGVVWCGMVSSGCLRGFPTDYLAKKEVRCVVS